MKRRKNSWKKVLEEAGENAVQFVGLKRSGKGRISPESGSDEPQSQTRKGRRNLTERKRFLETQDVHETRGNTGSYDKFVGDGSESIVANPDALPEREIAAPSTPQFLFGEAVEHLQGRQKEVYLLTMREGRSLAEAADLLGIEKSTAQKYRERAIEFISKYCQRAIDNGRV